MDLEFLAREQAKRWRHLDPATRQRWMNQFLQWASEHAPKDRVTPAGRIAEERRKRARLEKPRDPPGCAEQDAGGRLQ